MKLRIPEAARRTATPIGRKCRAEFAEVLSIEDRDGSRAAIDKVMSRRGGGLFYCVGETVRPDAYDDDPRVECTNGIHFFLTRKEAEEW